MCNLSCNRDNPIIMKKLLCEPGKKLIIIFTMKTQNDFTPNLNLPPNSNTKSKKRKRVKRMRSSIVNVLNSMTKTINKTKTQCNDNVEMNPLMLLNYPEKNTDNDNANDESEYTLQLPNDYAETEDESLYEVIY